MPYKSVSDTRSPILIMCIDSQTSATKKNHVQNHPCKGFSPHSSLIGWRPKFINKKKRKKIQMKIREMLNGKDAEIVKGMGWKKETSNT